MEALAIRVAVERGMRPIFTVSFREYEASINFETLFELALELGEAYGLGVLLLALLCVLDGAGSRRCCGGLLLLWRVLRGAAAHGLLWRVAGFGGLVTLPVSESYVW